MIEKKFLEPLLKKLKIEEYMSKTLDKAEYSHTDIKITPLSTRLIVYVGKPGVAIGRSGKTIDKLTQDLKEKFGIKDPQLDIQQIEKPDLDSIVIAKKIAKALERGVNSKRLIGEYLKKIVDAGAVGAEITISGKISGSRSRVDKVLEGYIKKCGNPSSEDVDIGQAKAILKQGTVGVTVKIMPYLPRMILMEKQLIERGRKEVEKKENVEEVKEEERISTEETKKEVKIKKPKKDKKKGE